MFILSAAQSLLYLKSPNFPESVVHGVTLRRGGFSIGPYSGLNMGLHVQDDVEVVRRNRKAWAEAFDINPDSVVAAEQVHGTEVHLVTRADWGKGYWTTEDAISGCDGLISREPGTCLISFYADCVPLFFYHPPTGAVGVAHAGWKGTLGEIGKKTATAFKEYFGADPADLIVGVGPSIGPCCYEVGEELADAFIDAFGPAVVRRTVSGRPHLDLWLANTVSLEQAGVKRQNIARADFCTACHPGLLYSHRVAQGHTGRMAAFIRVPRGL